MNQRTTLIAEIDLHTVQPLTFTHHGTEGLPLLTRGVDAEGRHQRTVYIPAAQLRGRLRHEAALAELRSRPEKAKLEDAYLLALGQDLRPNEDDEPEAIRLKEQQTFRAQNPLLDLFGTWKVASRLFVSHLMPTVNVQPDKVSHIRRDLDSNADMMDVLAESEQDRLYDRQGKQGLASKAEALIKLATRELAVARKAKDQAKLDELNAKVEELKNLKKTQKGDDTSDNTKHLLELQVIPAGITLSGKLTVTSASGRDLQTIVQALNGFSQMPYLGAQRARGCGEVHGSATFKNADGDVLAVVRFGGLQPAKIEWTAIGTELTEIDKTAQPA
jgi:CRISPR/Cas system CSM-associated protein Csm3 (group 7 of RAMP superfamily)